MAITAAAMTEEQLKRYHPFKTRTRKGNGIEARKLSVRIARGLGNRFGAKRVFLFGSLARRDEGPVFDIDLVAQGIPAAHFFEAVAFATGQAKAWKVDLVDIDDCSGPLRAAIEAEGVLIWPEKGLSSHPEF